MALIPKPPFPNVPKLPGVPQLLRSASFPPSPPPALGIPIALGRLWQALFVTPQWGVYDADNNRVVPADNIVSLNYRLEQVVSNFPVQAGSFSAFNSVDTPIEIALRFTKGGSEQQRANFLSDCEFITRSLSRYTILTPERSYSEMKAVRFELGRNGASGAYFFQEVDISFMQIREVSAQYTAYAPLTENAQAPAAQGTINEGRVQGQLPPPNVDFDPATALRVSP